MNKLNKGKEIASILTEQVARTYKYRYMVYSLNSKIIFHLKFELEISKNKIRFFSVVPTTWKKSCIQFLKLADD